jgi:error-prone DNA polymerase
LKSLVHADAFACFGLTRRQALWQIHALPEHAAPLDLQIRTKQRKASLPAVSLQYDMFQDYETTGLSLKAHPIQFIRAALTKQGVCSTAELQAFTKQGISKTVTAAGIVLFKQRPGTSKGVVFLTLEDETGTFNVVVLPHVFAQFTQEVLAAPALCIRGRLEKFEPPVYICAHEIIALPLTREASYDSLFNARSWSY